MSFLHPKLILMIALQNKASSMLHTDVLHSPFWVSLEWFISAPLGISWYPQGRAAATEASPARAVGPTSSQALTGLATFPN